MAQFSQCAMALIKQIPDNLKAWSNSSCLCIIHNLYINIYARLVIIFDNQIYTCRLTIIIGRKSQETMVVTQWNTFSSG